MPQSAEQDVPLPAGSVIGILGGGQLGRMMAQAASRMGYKCHIYSDTPDSPAAQVAWRETAAPYTDEAGLKELAESADVITLEFENIPTETLDILAGLGATVYPDKQVLATAQARDIEKTFLNRAGVETANWHKPAGPDDTGDITFPAILKANRLGYDGKGQTRVNKAAELAAAFKTIGSDDAILEDIVDFDVELSVIVARAQDGRVMTYTPSVNFHQDHILARSIAPAPVEAGVITQAQLMAHEIANAIGLVGVMGVEMFLTGDGKLRVNEVAPRPHNSGHWTMDACDCCQFEQHIRAITGHVLGSVHQNENVEMINLIGHDADNAYDYLIDARARLHLYGKGETRPGRKMGHVNILNPEAID